MNVDFRVTQADLGGIRGLKLPFNYYFNFVEVKTKNKFEPKIMPASICS